MRAQPRGAQQCFAGSCCRKTCPRPARRCNGSARACGAKPRAAGARARRMPVEPGSAQRVPPELCRWRWHGEPGMASLARRAGFPCLPSPGPASGTGPARPNIHRAGARGGAAATSAVPGRPQRWGGGSRAGGTRQRSPRGSTVMKTSAKARSGAGGDEEFAAAPGSRLASGARQQRSALTSRTRAR